MVQSTYRFRVEESIHEICFTKSGVFFHDGESWREQRRFALRYMRDFGFGRRFDSLEAEIEIQIRQFIDIIKHGPKFEHEKVVKIRLLVVKRMTLSIFALGIC